MDESALDLQGLTEEAGKAIAEADTLSRLDEIRVGYLGKNGRLTALLKQLGSLPPDQRPQAGQSINRAKQSDRKSVV